MSLDNVTFTLNPAGVSALTNPGGLIFKGMFSAGQQVRALAAARTGKATGKLAASYVTDVEATPDAVTVEVGTPVDYALYYMDGTRPHEIRPVRAKALRFVSGGKVVFAQRVSHPGTKPHPVLTDALEVIAVRVLGTTAALHSER